MLIAALYETSKMAAVRACKQTCRLQSGLVLLSVVPTVVDGDDGGVCEDCDCAYAI